MAAEKSTEHIDAVIGRFAQDVTRARLLGTSRPVPEVAIVHGGKQLQVEREGQRILFGEIPSPGLRLVWRDFFKLQTEFGRWFYNTAITLRDYTAIPLTNEVGIDVLTNRRGLYLVTNPPLSGDSRSVDTSVKPPAGYAEEFSVHTHPIDADGENSIFTSATDFGALLLNRQRMLIEVDRDGVTLLEKRPNYELRLDEFVEAKPETRQYFSRQDQTRAMVNVAEREFFQSLEVDESQQYKRGYRGRHNLFIATKTGTRLIRAAFSRTRPVWNNVELLYDPPEEGLEELAEMEVTDFSIDAG